MAMVLMVETRGRTWMSQAWYMQTIPPRYLGRAGTPCVRHPAHHPISKFQGVA